MKTFKEFMTDVNEANAFNWKEFTKGSRRVDGSTKTYHDVKKTSTGTVYTKQTDAAGISKDDGNDRAKSAEAAAPVKRGRGRPPGAYGSYKKKVKESVEFMAMLDESMIEAYINTLDEETLEELNMFLEETEGVDEAAKWRTHPDAHDYDEEEDHVVPKDHHKRDKLAVRQSVSKTQSAKDPKSMAATHGTEYAKKFGVDTKTLLKNR